MAITLNANFTAENEKAENTPIVLVKIPDTITDTTKTSAWGTNESESQVDYSSGEVKLDSQNSPAATLNVYTTAGTDYHTIGDIDYTDPVTYTLNTYNVIWQKFRIDSASSTLKLSALRLKLWYESTGGSGYTTVTTSIYTSPRIYSSGSGWTDYITNSRISYNLTIGTDTESTDLDIDFSYSTPVELTSGQDYWLMTWVQTFGGIVGNTVTKIKQTGEPFFKGEGRIENSRIDDEIVRSWQLDQKQIMFRFTTTAASPTEHYYTSGNIKIELDTGSVPTVNGEWLFLHDIPDFTGLTYTAWYSDNGTDYTSIGTVKDGDAITDLHRYYQVQASLTAEATTTYSTGAPIYSPAVTSIGVRFTEYLQFSYGTFDGYEPSVKGVTSQNTSIARDKKSAISQINLSFGLTDKISTWINTKYPKNKLVKILVGYAGLAESDFIDYYWGLVDDWSIAKNNLVSITCRDFRKAWNVPVPGSWDTTADDVYYEGHHPTEVIKSILRNYVDLRDSQIDIDSFDTVATSLSTQKVYRALTGETIDAETLIDELRQTMWCYFIPQPDGGIKLKEYDSAAAAEKTFTDADVKSIDYAGNSKSLINSVAMYYGYDPYLGKDDLSDFAAVYVTTDATSISNWNETKTLLIEDKWTSSIESAQISALATKILTRFKDIPALITIEADLRHLDLEVGDMINITTTKAPSSDLGGISDTKFEIIGKKFDFIKTVLRFTLLEV
jgi:hypothetical protein